MGYKDLQALERAWLDNRANQGLFTAYYNELKLATLKLLTKMLKVPKSQSERSDIAHDSITRMVEMYLKDPGYSLGINIVPRLHNELLQQLFNYRVKRYDKEVDIDLHLDVAKEVVEKIDFKEDLGWYEYSQLLEMAKTNKYRKIFLKELSYYFGENWVRTNVDALVHFHEFHKLDILPRKKEV